VRLDFLFFIFLLLRGRGVEFNVFFCLHLTCGKGLVFFLKFSFIVEWLGTRGHGFLKKYV